MSPSERAFDGHRRDRRQPARSSWRLTHVKPLFFGTEPRLIDVRGLMICTSEPDAGPTPGTPGPDAIDQQQRG